MSEEVQLYRCHPCGKQRFSEELFHNGDSIIFCRCGSRKVSMITRPTFWDVLVYLIHHPRRTLDYIREDVLGWN
jgi:hypothetical protein